VKISTIIAKYTKTNFDKYSLLVLKLDQTIYDNFKNNSIELVCFQKEFLVFLKKKNKFQGACKLSTPKIIFL